MGSTVCSMCKGVGVIDALVNVHGDEKETITCPKCGGKGSINYMSDEDEADYHNDYW